MNKLHASYLLCGAMLGLSACGGGGGGGTPTPTATATPSGVGTDFDFQSMFTNLADNVIIPNYAAFESAAIALADTSGPIENYCASIGIEEDGVVESILLEAQESWRQAMTLWQYAEVHTLGPAADEDSSLRKQIYAYDSDPLDTCLTDRVVVFAEDPDFDMTGRPFSARGLDALEYLLFNDDLAHSCSAEQSNEQTDPWNDRTELERQQARCDYALDVALDIEEAATAIHSAWLPSGEDYRQTFIDGSQSNSDVILSFISDAMFYIEQDSKDNKLGVPLGINADCTTLACPEAVESPYSNHALQNLKANIESFANLYTGVDGLSFDDIISAAGLAEINTAFAEDAAAITALIDSMIANDESVLAQAQAILNSVDGQDADACEASLTTPEVDTSVSACALYGLFSQQNDRLRTDFISVVGVDLPNRVQGDSD